MSSFRAFLWMVVAAVTMWWPVVSQAQSADLPTVSYTGNGGSFSNPTLTTAVMPGRVFTNTAAGGVTVTDAVSALIGGRAVAMSLARGLSKSQVATVAARCLLNPICVGSAAAVAVAGTLVSRRCRIEGGQFQCDAGSDSQMVPGTEWNAGNQWASTPDAACISRWGPGGTSLGYNNVRYFPQYNRCGGDRIPDGVTQLFGTELSTRNVQVAGCIAPAVLGPDGRCSTGVYSQPSVDQLGNTINGLPTGAVDGSGIVGDGLRAGVPVDGTTPGTLSGPASIPGSTTQTTTGSGTTTTTNSTSITYGGNSYTYHNTTVTVAPDGTTTTTEETPTDVAPPNNPALGEIPSLYTRAYPEGMVGVWNTKRAALQSTPIFGFVNSFVPQTGDGGCPAWTIPSGNLMGISVGGNVSIPCSVWSFIRLVMVCSALLLARALVFGG